MSVLLTTWRPWTLMSMPLSNLKRVETDENDAYRGRQAGTVDTGRHWHHPTTATSNTQRHPQCNTMNIKADKHFLHYCNELVLDLQQKSDEPIHSLNTNIIQLINTCQFSNNDTKETFKLIILEHTVKNHHTRYCIHLQDQSMLTHDKLFPLCRILET